MRLSQIKTHAYIRAYTVCIFKFVIATCLNMDTKQTVAVKILKKTDDIVGAEEEVNIIQPFDVYI